MDEWQAEKTKDAALHAQAMTEATNAKLQNRVSFLQVRPLLTGLLSRVGLPAPVAQSTEGNPLILILSSM